MMKRAEMQELISTQLYKYREAVRVLEQYEAIEIRACEGGIFVRNNKQTHINPTAGQAMQILSQNAGTMCMQGWVRAIEQAWARLEEEAPLKARLMELLYGLKDCEYMGGTASKRDELTQLLNISEPTVCRWREDIFHAVGTAAIEIGVLSPYGLTAVQMEEQ